MISFRGAGSCPKGKQKNSSHSHGHENAFAKRSTNSAREYFRASGTIGRWNCVRVVILIGEMVCETVVFGASCVKKEINPRAGQGSVEYGLPASQLDVGDD